MPADAKAQNTRKRKNRRWLILGLSLPVLLITVIAVAVAYLRSDAGSKRLLIFIQNSLERDYGMRFEFSEGKLDILAGLRIKSPRLIRLPEERLFSADAFDLEFSFSIFQRKVVIESFRLDRPVIHISNLKTPKTAASARTSETGMDPGSLLKSPPVAVEIRDLNIDGLALDYSAHVGDEEMSVQVKNFAMTLKAEVSPGKVVTSGSFQIHQPARVASRSASSGFSGKLAGTGRWSAEILFDGKQWLLDIKPTKFDIEGEDLNFHVRQGSSESKGSVSKMKALIDVHLLAKTDRLQANADAVKTNDLKADVTLGPVHLEERGVGFRQSTSLREVKFVIGSRLEGQNVAAKVATTLVDLKRDGLTNKPLRVTFVLDATAPRDLTQVGYRANALIDDLTILTMEGSIRPMDESKSLVGKLALFLDPRLSVLLKPAQALRQTGRLELSSENSIRFLTKDQKYEFDAELSVRNDHYGSWRIKTKSDLKSVAALMQSQGSTEIEVLRAPDPRKIPVVLEKPLRIRHRVALGGGKDELDVNVESEALRFKDQLRVTATRIELETRSPNLRGMQKADLKMKVSQGPLEFLVKGEAPPLPIAGLRANAWLSLRDGGNVVTIEKFDGDLNDGTIYFAIKGAGNARNRDGQMQAEIGLNLQKPLEIAPGKKLRGAIKVPATIAIYHGREVSVSGAVEMANVAVEAPGFGVDGVSGRIPFSEKLIMQAMNFRFASLITQNPFERVDFERVRPLLQGADQLKFEKLSWEDRSYGPFIGYFSFVQNMLSIHQFDLDLVSGRLYGEMFFDAYPANLRLGVLSRLTSVDLGEVLPRRFLARIAEGGKNVSGRAGFVLNINRALLDGRIDVTEIGGPQLVAFINVLDPGYEDEKMNKVRSLLGIGFPTAVAMSFREGFMNMDVDLSVLGLKQRQSLREIPISRLLAGATADIVKKAGKGPFK